MKIIVTIYLIGLVCCILSMAFTFKKEKAKGTFLGTTFWEGIIPFLLVVGFWPISVYMIAKSYAKQKNQKQDLGYWEGETS